MNAFQTANYIEAGLWVPIGIGFLVHAALARTAKRTTPIIAALIFLAFAVSDVIETQTGAWWRPWWLLAWKGVCVAAIVGLLTHYRIDKWRRRGTGFQPVRAE